MADAVITAVNSLHPFTNTPLPPTVPRADTLSNVFHQPRLTNSASGSSSADETGPSVRFKSRIRSLILVGLMEHLARVIITKVSQSYR